MIPHYAAPLSAVDDIRVAEHGDGMLVTATKEITASGPYQAAHFPGRAVYPGVFIMETVRQAVIAALGEGPDGGLADLSAIHSLRFTGAMHPGEQLLAAVTVGLPQRGAVAADARCQRADGTEVARMSLKFEYQGGSDA